MVKKSVSGLALAALLLGAGSLVVYGSCYTTKPANTDQGCAIQQCGLSDCFGTCAYSTSSQNTLCDCPGNACSGNGNSVPVTITPYNGYCAQNSNGCYCNAMKGQSTQGSGQVNSANCP